MPAGQSRHELYCEVSGPVPIDEARSSRWNRVKERFRRAVAEGEAEQARHPTDPPRTDQGRLRRAITRKLAEVVIEQRLLWHLRTETTVRLFHPDSMDSARAVALAHASNASDYARHMRWFVIDALVTLVTGPLFFFVPGPNVISWYFTFRAVGHFLSMRGARQGLRGIAWTGEPTPHLTAVAHALTCEPARRAELLAQAGSALGLEGLARFVERVAVRPA